MGLASPLYGLLQSSLLVGYGVDCAPGSSMRLRRVSAAVDLVSIHLEHSQVGVARKWWYVDTFSDGSCMVKGSEFVLQGLLSPNLP